MCFVILKRESILPLSLNLRRDTFPMFKTKEFHMKKPVIAFAICCSLSTVFFAPLSANAFAASSATPPNSSVVTPGGMGAPVLGGNTQNATSNTQNAASGTCNSSDLAMALANQAIATAMNAATGNNQASDAAQSNVCS
jgi:hypothetical protein